MGVALLFGGLASLGARESLWLDELHTSWTISGTWSEIAARASDGNQPPLYFWLQRVVTKTLGQTEVTLRLFSILSSMAAAYFVYRILWALPHTTSPTAKGPTLGQKPRLLKQLFSIFLVVGCWLVLDRIQLFYATEARVYALLQLISLLGWLIVGQVVALQRTAAEAEHRRRGVPLTTSFKLEAAWLGLSWLAIHLQLISLLFVGWQAAFLFGYAIWQRDGRMVSRWAGVLCLLVLGVSPTVELLQSVWRRREQWEAFAGDASWSTVVSTFAILPLWIPVLIVSALDRVGQRIRANKEPDPTGAFDAENSTASILASQAGRLPPPQARERTLVMPQALVWITAAIGPLLTAWLATATELTPILHRRYLLCSGLPFIILAGWALLRVRSTKLRFTALFFGSLWLFASQGSLNVWTHSQLIGTLRGEDWRAASRWVSQRIGSDDALWCASGLIEAAEAEVPPAPQMNAYLSFPLRGLYRVRSTTDQTVSPRALFGNVTSWRQLLASGRNGAGEQLWIVYRGSPVSLKEKLDLLAVSERSAASRANSPLSNKASESSLKLSIVAGPKSFGRVQAVELEWHE